MLQKLQASIQILNLLDAHPAPVGFAQFVATDDFQELHEHDAIAKVRKQVENLEAGLDKDNFVGFKYCFMVVIFQNRLAFDEIAKTALKFD